MTILRPTATTLVFAVLLLGGCPQATNDSSASLRPLISPGRYIGLITTITSQRTTSGVTVDVAEDGTVSINNSRYAPGDMIVDSFEDSQLIRTIGDVSRTSDTILIQYTEVWEIREGVNLIGEGSTRLLWTDARTIDYFDANLTVEPNPPPGLQPISISAESSGVLTR